MIKKIYFRTHPIGGGYEQSFEPITVVSPVQIVGKGVDEGGYFLTFQELEPGEGDSLIHLNQPNQ